MTLETICMKCQSLFSEKIKPTQFNEHYHLVVLTFHKISQARCRLSRPECLTGDQEVVCSILARSGTILYRLIMKYFCGHPLSLVQEGQLSVSGKRMCTSSG